VYNNIIICQSRRFRGSWAPQCTVGNPGHSGLTVLVVLYVRHVVKWSLLWYFWDLLRKNLEKKKCLYHIFGQACRPVWYIANNKVKCIFVPPPLRNIYGYLSISAFFVKMNYNDTSDKSSWTLKYISRIEVCNE
jgi:hypothetical protein